MTPYQRWPAPVAAAVALLLACTVVTAASTELPNDAMGFHAASSVPEFRCGYDAVVARSGETEADGDVPVVVGDDGAEGRLGDAVPAASAPFGPIRIRLSFLDLHNSSRYCEKVGQVRPNFSGGNETCRDVDILTNEKRGILKKRLVRGARKLHQERLNVQRMTFNIPAGVFANRGLCRFFTIPEQHKQKGVVRADFVLYVASGPDHGHGTWAAYCGKVNGGRPIIGATHISTSYIRDDFNSERTVAHEMLHALGFNLMSFADKNIIQKVQGPRGKTLQVPALVSPKVMAAAKAHFGCPSMTYLELEDAGDDGTPGSHWKMRNMQDDLMAPTGVNYYYTAMTMAAMEDLGYYTANYERAEVMPWGHKAGCDFLNEKCVTNSQTKFPSMFCTDTSRITSCTSDHSLVGFCAIDNRGGYRPSYFQYFSDPETVGISGPFMDYCPVIVGSWSCDRVNSGNPGTSISTHGRKARCFDITPVDPVNWGNNRAVGAICAKVRCKKCKYTIRVKGATKATPCKPGSTLSLPDLSSEFKEGTLTCPRYSEVCTDTVNPASENGPFTPLCDDSETILTTTTVPPLPPSLSGGIQSTIPAFVIAVLAFLY